MRRFLTLWILILLVLLFVGVSSQVILAKERPFRPGDVFYPVQDLAEQIQAKITIGKTNQALYYLSLAQQRTEDFVVLEDGEYARLAADCLSRALDQAIKAIVAAPQDDLVFLTSHLNDLVIRIDEALANFLEIHPDRAHVIAALQAKVETLGMMLAETRIIDLASGDLISAEMSLNLFGDPGNRGEVDMQGIPPHEILFPPGSPGALHLFYPLVGKHAELDCFVCHSSGQYAGTLNLCSSCHVEEKPADHFPGECTACHTPIDWLEVVFDHSIIDTTDCLSCHLTDKPANHYVGQCSGCHNTIDWSQATFNHQVVDTKDCQFCHVKDKPTGHYSGQCSGCHNTTNWVQANFNHQVKDATDCLSCHTQNKPSNHFTGQCSLCHKTSTWTGAIFNHTAYGAVDCKACHAGEKPANHFTGQCSACHNTSSWREATFNHAASGATDCKSCHSGDKPGNHFTGQCSACHSTSSWSGANFDHGVAGATDCITCHSGDRPSNHFSGQCSTCHSTSSWSGATFNHKAAGATDCIACHSGDKPSNHFEGQCSQCHSTSSWGGATFDHGFPINHGSAKGVCSQCHPSGGSKWTCYTCHDKNKMIKHHDEKGISDIGGRCLNCHPNGNEGDEDD